MAQGPYVRTRDTLRLTWPHPDWPQRPASFTKGSRFIVFLTGGIQVGDGCAAYYFDEVTVSLTDRSGLSALFEVKDGTIAYTPLPQYHGWSVDRFEAAIRAVPSTPSPTVTPTPVRSIAELVRQSEAIAEVQVADPRVELVTQMAVQPLVVERWFKNPYNLGDTGLRLFTTRRLGCFLPSSIGNHYILFLRYATYPELLRYPAHWTTRTFDGSTFMLVGPAARVGAFEIRDGHISQAGVPQYQGWAVADFEAEIRAALPPTSTATATPPPPTAMPTTTTWTLAKLVQQAEVVAAVTLGDGGPAGAGIDQVRLNVQRWLKKPVGPTLTQLALNRYSSDRAHWPRSFWSGEALILFLSRDRPCCSSDEYYLTGGVLNGAPGVFVIRSGKLLYAGLSHYQGWAVADFEAEIRALLAHPELGSGASPH